MEVVFVLNRYILKSRRNEKSFYDCPALDNASLCQLRLPPRSSNSFTSSLKTQSQFSQLWFFRHFHHSGIIIFISSHLATSFWTSFSTVWFSSKIRKFSLFSSHQPTSGNGNGNINTLSFILQLLSPEHAAQQQENPYDANIFALLSFGLNQFSCNSLKIDC